MPSSNVNSSTPKNKRWTSEEHIFFVSLLHETCDYDPIQSKKSTVLKSALESCRAQLQTKFPETKWLYQRIRSRYDLIKLHHRAYQAALKMPGKVEALSRGKIYLSPHDEADLRESHPPAIARMLNNGLGVSGCVTVDTYHQIFSSHIHTGGSCTLTGGQEVAPYDKPSLHTRPLSTLPPELLSMIGSYFSHQELRVVTLLSKHFRNFFSAQLFTRLRFSGDLKRLGQHLKSFLSGLSTHWSRIVEYRPRYATFLILDAEPEEYTIGSPDSPVALMGDFLRSMPGLEGVVFDLRFNNAAQVENFNDLLQKTEVWTSPRSVIFKCAKISNFDTILRHFSPGTLNAVQLPINSCMYQYPALQSSCKSLEALHVYTMNVPRHATLSRCLDFRVLESIHLDFPDIKSIILDENIENVDFHDNWSRPELNIFDQSFKELTSLLNQMPHLRRFSFKLWKKHLDGKFSHQDWSRSLGIQPRADLSVDTRYATLICALLTAIPGLEELCISDHYRSFYRGTRIENTSDARIEWLKNSDQEHRFPSVLAS